MELTGKTAIVTGATSGIGFQTALALASRDAQLILPARNLQKAEDAKNRIVSQTGNKNIEVFQCELSSMESIRQFATHFNDNYDQLHILVNNAGIWETTRKLSADGVEMVFAVNHLAPFLLTNLLLGKLKAADKARIVTVSSGAHIQGKINFQDIEYNKSWNHFKVYAQSKLANILFTRELARRLEGTAVTANCLHPGVVSTHLFDNMGSFMKMLFQTFMISPEKGAQTSIYLAISPEVENVSGEYFAKSKPKKTASAASDMETAAKLWTLSEKYTGLQA